jgi:hypothetical protein
MSEKETAQIGKGKAGPGRPKGVPNKVNALLRDEILQAAEAAHPEGRVGYLAVQAQENPVAFMTLLGKVLPTQIAGAGENGEHLHKVTPDDAFAAFAAALGGHAPGTGSGNHGAGEVEGDGTA